MAILFDRVQPQKTAGSRVEEEIEGVIRVFEGGYVQRFPLVREVPSSWRPEPGVASCDAVIDPSTLVWARLFVPDRAGRCPLIVYFHGGGFCVGSASWECYHGFTARLAAATGCVVMSVNYRLAPEHRLPAAYDDGVAAVRWAVGGGGEDLGWWRDRCDLSRVFLAGDSAGAAVAHHAARRLSGGGGVAVKGIVLVQPFFGGEERTGSERTLDLSAGSILTLKTSDAYWRLALPVGARRDHPWCNPLASGGGGGPKASELPPVLAFAAEKDIARDRAAEFCEDMRRAGRRAELVLHTGVGHAFQVLDCSPVSQERTRDMLSRIKTFIDRCT